MRILLTGGAGQLGSEMLRTATAAGHEVRSTTRAECDITNPVAVRETIEDARAEVVINCAAWTDVDGAEADPDAAFRANALGPRILAAACAARDILLVHLSTDYVFDGSHDQPIDEWQTPSPRSLYGASKLAGENEVRGIARRHQVVRTSWLYGGRGPNFILTIQRAASQGHGLRVVSDQFGSPTWTGHLAAALLHLIARDVPGTYHLTNAGVASRHDLAEAVVSAGGYHVAVVAVTTAEYPTAAPRPRYSVLDNRVWRLLGEAPLPDWREGVAAYLASSHQGAPPGDWGAGAQRV
jgi:dTDP-4-dehydrorhamnose reductase